MAAKVLGYQSKQVRKRQTLQNKKILKVFVELYKQVFTTQISNSEEDLNKGLNIALSKLSLKHKEACE